MAGRVNVFFVEQLFFLGIFFVISIVSANGITNRTALWGKAVELSCSLPVSNETVQWKLGIEKKFLASCASSTEACIVLQGTASATRSNKSSTLSLTPATEVQQQVYCSLGDNTLETFNVRFVNITNISPPNCSIIPTTSSQGKETKIRFSCESYVPHELFYNLSLFGLSGNISKIGVSDLHVVNDVDVDNFTDSVNGICELMILDVNINGSCSFPHSINVTYTPDVTDALFNCHVDPDDNITWRFLDPKGREENMTGRSWTRDGGRSLLIKNIDEKDLGKLAECRINGSVGFGVIDEIGSSGNELDNNDGIGTHVGHSDRSVYVTLTYVFGGALLITLLIVISHWRCGVCAHPLKWYAQFKPHDKPKTSTMNQPSGSIGRNVSGVGSNSRSRGRDVDTINLSSGNQNNSALNHPRDPTPQTKATSSSDDGASTSVHPDQPVIDSNQHTYFCVERSTPPPSLPDLSTSGPYTIYQDPDYEESQRQRLRDSAGYDVVDASKKQMNNNPDMDDYAEVGGAYDKTSNPAIAPRSSKGWTGKGVVMPSDPAVLYGKVNK